MNIGLDFDGTLLDSTLRHQIVLFYIVNRFFHGAHDVKFSDFDDFVCFKSIGRTTKDYLITKNIHPAEQIAALWVRHIECEEYLAFDSLYHDALMFVKENHNKNNLFLVTSRNNCIGTLAQIKHLNLSAYFKEVLIIDPGSNVSKFEKTSNLDLDIIVGDTEVDFAWATGCGSLFFALNRGFRNKLFWNNLDVESYSTLTDIQTKLTA